MPHPNFVIILIVSRGDLHSTSTEFHVNRDSVCHDRQTTIKERMRGKLSMEVLWDKRGEIFRSRCIESLTVYRGSSGWTAIAVSPNIVSGRVVATIILSSANDIDMYSYRVHSTYEPTWTFNNIRKTCNNTKFKFFLDVVPRDVQKGSSSELFLVHFQVRECRVELNTPVDQSIRAVDNTVFMKFAESFDYGFRKTLLNSRSETTPIIKEFDRFTSSIVKATRSQS